MVRILRVTCRTSTCQKISVAQVKIICLNYHHYFVIQLLYVIQTLDKTCYVVYSNCQITEIWHFFLDILFVCLLVCISHSWLQKHFQYLTCSSSMVVSITHFLIWLDKMNTLILQSINYVLYCLQSKVHQCGHGYSLKECHKCDNCCW